MRWAVIVLLGVFLFSFASALDTSDCDDSMVAYWQFEDSLVDGYGSHDGGSWSGVSAYGAVLSTGLGASFAGSSNVTIDDATDLRFSSSFTIEMWVEATDSGIIFEKGNYKIEWIKGSGLPAPNNIRVSVGNVVLDSETISASVPHYVAVVWDAGSAENLSLYVDGVSVSGTLTGASDATTDLVLGYGFKGLIDELAIYSRALSASELGLHRGLTNAGKDYCDLSGAGGTSVTRTDFSVNGCTFVGSNGLNVDVSRGKCSIDPNYGEFYCDDDLFPWITSEVGLGCAMGNSDYDTTNNDSFCCPHGYFCNETTSGGEFRCSLRPETCAEQLTQTDCNAVDIGCIWFDGVCIEGLGDFDCGYYEKGVDAANEEIACNADRFNLSKVGIGTGMCGETIQCADETYSIPVDNCACAWYDGADDGKKCQVKLVAMQFFHQTGVDPNSFSCSSSYELGPCEGGQQLVNWTSQVPVADLIGFTLGDENLTKCLTAIGCDSDSDIRSCGEPIIKLPGFSLFAFFASLFIVGMYYYFRE
ncbi:LamG domain-containing protein [archaeon]|nr:LamG domain-containing protein [archaeon]